MLGASWPLACIFSHVIYGQPPSPSGPQFIQVQDKNHPTVHNWSKWDNMAKYLVVVQSLNHVQLFCGPMECSLPGSSVHGIFQARILEWVAISFSRGSSPPRDRTQVSCIGRRILYHWATREARQYLNHCITYREWVRLYFPIPSLK